MGEARQNYLLSRKMINAALILVNLTEYIFIIR